MPDSTPVAGIQAFDVSAHQRDLILAIEEGHFCDLKAIEIAPGKLSRTLSAFANATGGELYVGIDEIRSGATKARKWRGFPDQEAANAHLQVFQGLFPLGEHFSYQFIRCAEAPGLVLKAQVLKTRDVKVASDGVPYLRLGAQNLPVGTPEKLRRLELDKGIVSFETETLSVDRSVVSNSTVLLQFLLDVVPSAEPEPWLRSQLLLREGKPTVAAALLYSEEPQALLPKRCGIKVLRYETRKDEGTRATLSFQPATIEGHLYQQVYSSVAKVVEIVSGIRILGPSGLEPIQYPPEAIHEVITNAVLHRDYSLATDIQIRIFDNRVEVESPGRLPGHVTTENIRQEQFARNGAIVRLVNKFPNPPNKDVGEGLDTAFEAMKRLKLREPEIEETSSSVLVRLRHEPLASPEDAVMRYLETHDSINNSVGRNLTGITSENAMKRVFYALAAKGLLEKVPGKRGAASAWRKPDSSLQRQ